ncbi:MAG: 3-isopropylmalate dehydratase large subunit [Candidatus Woesearchaeota archaeon]|nr:3-isopropylmalate dehydratase large subunit [Candidatus Woesearchaeota archaeon]
MGYTIAEKILMARAGAKNVQPGDIVTVEPDRVMSHDNTAFIIKKFLQTGYTEPWNKEKLTIIFDHCVPATNPAHKQNHDEARAFAKEHNLPYFYDDKAGVCHQVMMEEGLVLPGSLTVGCDSHSTLYGAMNCLGIPINRTEMAGIWATGKIWLKVPETIKIVLEGELQEGVFAKDIILHLLSILRADGATYKVLEFTGSTVSTMSMGSRMTLANMAVELGGKAGVFPFDEKTKAYLTGRTDAPYEPVESDTDAHYCETVTVDVSQLEPQVSCPHTVDNVKPISEVVGKEVQQAYLGSCTNGRLEDLQAAAAVLKGKKVADTVRLVVYPASAKVKEEAIAAGVIKELEEAGAEIRTNSCGPCFGAVDATLGDHDVCISSSNRNFCGRMGSAKSFVYLASPAVVAASAIAGKIADPREVSQ